MSTSWSDEEGADLPSRTVGPIVLLVPVALLFLAVSLLVNPSSPTVNFRAEPPVRPSDSEVAGWQGEIELPNGQHWRATLGPLHSDAERQAFDAEALRARYGLGPGEPFKLELVEVSVGSSTEARELWFHPEDLMIADGEGMASFPLTPQIVHPNLDELFLMDPLKVLLGVPEKRTPAGTAATWIMFGRAPKGAATVTPIGVSSGHTIPLEARKLSRAKVDVALLRRDQ